MSTTTTEGASSGPFHTMQAVREEIASWGINCKQCGARFWPVRDELFCDGC